MADSTTNNEPKHEARKETRSYIPDSFLSYMQGLPDDTAGTRCLILGNKLFLIEDTLDATLAEYAQWLSEATQSSVSKQDAYKKLFTVPYPPLFYLPHGNHCYVGHVLQHNENVPGGAVLQLQSAAISAENFIHPSDSSLQDSRSVRLSRDPARGSFVELRGAQKSVRLREAVAREIVSLLRQDKKVTSRWPKIGRSLRDALPVLAEVVLSAKTLSKKQPLLVPREFVGQDNISFLASFQLVFVLQDNELLSCYATQGAACEAMIERELLSLQAGIGFIGKLKIGSVQRHGMSSRGKTGRKDSRKGSSDRDHRGKSVPGDSRYLGTVKNGKSVFSLEKKACVRFIEQLPSMKSAHTLVNGAFTVKEVVEKISELISEAVWVSEAPVIRGAQENQATTHQGQKADSPTQSRKVLRFVPWTFMTGKNYSIFGIREGGQTGQGRGHRRKGRPENSRREKRPTQRNSRSDSSPKQ